MRSKRNAEPFTETYPRLVEECFIECERRQARILNAMRGLEDE